MIRAVRMSLVGMGLLGVGLLLPSPLWAQATSTSNAELAAARILFGEARELEKLGHWEQALPKLEAVGRVRMTAQVRFHIALCHLHTGKLVAARNGFEQARRDAREEQAEQVVRESTQHISDLDARIPTLRIVLVNQPADFSFLVDDDPIDTGLLTVPLPLDPGAHHIRANAPGYTAFETTVVLEESTPAEVSIELVPTQPVPRTKPHPPASPKPPATQQEHSSPLHPKDEASSNAMVGWILVGTGGGMLVGALASAVVRANAISDIDESCPLHTDCDPSLESTRNRAQTYGTVAGILGGLGAIGVGAGGYLLWTSDSEPTSDTSITIQPKLHLGNVGMEGTVRW